MIVLLLTPCTITVMIINIIVILTTVILIIIVTSIITTYRTRPRRPEPPDYTSRIRQLGVARIRGFRVQGVEFGA